MHSGTGNAPRPVALSALEEVRSRVESALLGFLARQGAEIEGIEASAFPLMDELERIVRAGGKRLRPALCYWGYRAAGGKDGDPIIRAAAALELLHTFALVHDDVMDAAERRRGVPTSQVHLAEQYRRRGLPGDPERFGLSVAILVGDLAAVLADHLLLVSGFPPEALAAAMRRYDRMRTEMAVGQFMDVGGAGPVDGRMARRIALLKTGSYTVEGPLHIGAILAGGSGDVMVRLSRYAVPLGEAFQLRDDLADAEQDRRAGAHTGGGAAGGRERVNRLVRKACAALDPDVLSPEAVEALRSLAELVALP